MYVTLENNQKRLESQRAQNLAMYFYLKFFHLFLLVATSLNQVHVVAELNF